MTLTTAAATSLPKYSTASPGIITKSYTEDQLTTHEFLCEENVLNDDGISYCDLGTTYQDQGEKIVQTATKRGKSTAKTKGEKKGRKSGGKKAADKKRLLLRKVNTERKERLNKKLYYFIDASTSDEQVLKEVMNDHLDFFKQLRGIINSTTFQEQDFKEQKLKEILEPTLKTFTMHILRHDYQFVNATLNEENLRLQKTRIEHAINKLNPEKKGEQLYGEDVVTKIQSNILKEINRDSVTWYNNEGDTGLSEKNIIQFLRNASKDYVGVLFGEQNIKRAAILDTSLAGVEIRKIANSTKFFFEGKIDSENPVEMAIIERFKEYVKTEIKRATKNNNLKKLTKLYKLYTDVHIDENMKNEIIDEVKLLWSIFDNPSKEIFEQSAQETDQQKRANLFEWVKGDIDYYALLNKLKFFQGKDEVTQQYMEFILSITMLVYFSKVAVAILNSWWLKSGNGASEPASQEPTKSKRSAHRKTQDKPVVKAQRNEELIKVFMDLKGDPWIENTEEDGYIYRRISNRGRRDNLYYKGKKTQKNVTFTKQGTIGTDGELTWNE